MSTKVFNNLIDAQTGQPVEVVCVDERPEDQLIARRAKWFGSRCKAVSEQASLKHIMRVKSNE